MLKDYLPTFELVKKESHEFRFTVFIPVYNAENTIGKVFDSLENQIFRDFEIIVINDGSTDNSHHVISQRIRHLNFRCTYIKNKTNVNKMGVFIQAIKLAKGDFFLTHDADDECIPEALGIFNERYEDIPEDLKIKISGVTSRCKSQFGELIGKPLPEDPFFSNSFESSVLHDLSFEKWGFVKTRLLKSIQIDDFIIGKGLIPEGIIWLVFAKQGYITKYCSDILRIYHVDNTNSLTSLKYDKKALGMALHGLLFINYFYSDYFLKAPMHFLKRTYAILKSANFLDYDLNNYLASIDPILIKMIFLLVWPIKKYL
ncbi:Undecaprenyl-phosphate 4-deoxy-4-formamido-L-arabinose transferase [Arenibacter antarcticus]|uniref:Glycosyltransferase family 2 protein n=1 Tax=Arenibacter antarcticus TaxID=2040469 RepID=A0ABW5VFW9_9FLAO|nr:glycosyltransferase family 2 protein [Arenibacter sp. H213]MCM4167348.1 glycosyltransferase family 2 protein [Arenibacter sp. H213]